MTYESSTDPATDAMASPESLAPSDPTDIVGSGPGAPASLTLRAERRIADADVVFAFDRLTRDDEAVTRSTLGALARAADGGDSSRDRISDLSILVVRRGST